MVGQVPVRPEPNLTAMRIAFSTKRKAGRLTYEDVAEKSGIARRTVQRLETGEREGNLKTWFYLANAVDLQFSTLVSSLYDEPAPDGES